MIRIGKPVCYSNDGDFSERQALFSPVDRIVQQDYSYVHNWRVEHLGGATWYHVNVNPIVGLVAVRGGNRRQINNDGLKQRGLLD